MITLPKPESNTSAPSPTGPQTNGKVERFNRILQEEWAYARAYGSEAERQACYQGFFEHYNH